MPPALPHPPRYWTSPEGTVYRVLDGLFRRGRYPVVDPPGPAWIPLRIFRPRDGSPRQYRFSEGEDRTALDDATLSRQFSTALVFEPNVRRLLERIGAEHDVSFPEPITFTRPEDR